MRVLLNALQAGNRSGTGRYTEELANLLVGEHKGIEVHVAWPEHVPKGFAPEGYFHRIPSQGAGVRIRFDQFGIHKLARRIGADLIHFPANVGGLFGKTPTVLTVHDLSFFRDPRWYRWERAFYYRQSVRLTVRRAARILADSEATAADLREYLGVPDERIAVIPLGCGPEFNPDTKQDTPGLRERMQLPGRFLLFVGTLEPRKNVAQLIEAFDRIADGIPQDLVVAGREGWKTGPIHEALNRARHRGRIHLPGFVAHEDLPTLLRMADAFVFPSVCEGFGLPPLEAMACGTPVLTSNISSLPEVTGDAAVLVDPVSVDAIADGLNRVSTDDALREELRSRGIERAAGFTWRRTAELTREAYERAQV